MIHLIQRLGTIVASSDDDNDDNNNDEDGNRYVTDRTALLVNGVNNSDGKYSIKYK